MPEKIYIRKKKPARWPPSSYCPTPVVMQKTGLSEIYELTITLRSRHLLATSNPSKSSSAVKIAHASRNNSRNHPVGDSSHYVPQISCSVISGVNIPLLM